MAWLDEILEQGQHAARLSSDLEYFCANALKLRPKAGPLEPFTFNAAQRKLHQVIEEQKAKTGRVRVVILKARAAWRFDLCCCPALPSHDQFAGTSNHYSRPRTARIKQSVPDCEAFP